MILKIIKKLKCNKQGVTLMELLVAMAIFSVVILSATQIFKMVIEGQRSAIASDNVQSNMRYISELVSKEIRMAQRSDNECDEIFDVTSTNRAYNEADNELGEALYFKNKDNECVIYYLKKDEDDVQRLRIERWSDGENVNDGYLTSNNIWVDNLQFLVNDNTISGSKAVQPSVTMSFDVSAIGSEIHAATTTIQTTISSRYYE